MSILAHSRGSTTREQMKNCFCRHHSPRNKSRRHHKHRSCDHTVINFSNKLKHVLHIPSTRLSKEPKTFLRPRTFGDPESSKRTPSQANNDALWQYTCAFSPSFLTYQWSYGSFNIFSAHVARVNQSIDTVMLRGCGIQNSHTSALPTGTVASPNYKRVFF